MDQVINLDRNDDILKVHSKIEWSDGRRVILVVPRGCKALDSEHELRLLRRWADNADQVVGLVSSDINVQEMARDVGLPLFSTVEKAQRARWKWNRNGNGVLARVNPLNDGEPRLSEPLLDRLGLAGVQFLVTLILFGLAAAVVLAAAVLLIPSANITVIPASTAVNDTSEVILDSSVTTIDQINAIVPGDLYRREISGTATIPTTKTDTAPADHATGQVVFTNLAGTPATIPLGTIVATTSGVTVRFSTTVEAQLPGDFNARVTVPIRALDPGPIGNVKAFQINFIDGPASAVARVINPSPTGGGTIKPVHIVSFDDKDALRSQLSDQLRRTAIAQMEADLGSDAYVAPASVEVLVLNENFDHLVDDPSDTLTLHVNAIARGMYASYKDLYKFAESRLLTKFPAGYSVLPGTLKVEADPNARVEGSSVIMRVHSSESGTPQVATDSILKGLTGKSLDEASQLISQRVKLAEPPLIRVNPSWWPRLPFFGFRLAVFVKPVEDP